MTTTWRNWLIKNKKGLEITLSETDTAGTAGNRMNDRGIIPHCLLFDKEGNKVPGRKGNQYAQAHYYCQETATHL